MIDKEIEFHLRKHTGAPSLQAADQTLPCNWMAPGRGTQDRGHCPITQKTGGEKQTTTKVVCLQSSLSRKWINTDQRVGPDSLVREVVLLVWLDWGWGSLGERLWQEQEWHPQLPASQIQILYLNRVTNGIWNLWSRQPPVSSLYLPWLLRPSCSNRLEKSCYINKMTTLILSTKIIKNAPSCKLY